MFLLMRYHTHREIIKAWPSLTEMASDLGVRYDTVQKWHVRNSIPSDRWLQVVRCAIKRDIPGVTFEVLDELRTGHSVRCADE